MSVIGIVGEYNPFHYGHKHHISETRKLLGNDYPVVCVMSGDFIQRGEAAVYSKFARAEAAVRSGADLVLELPLPWSLSSAEGFARGSVAVLGATGVVTHLSFGSECGDIKPLSELAGLLLDPLFGAAIKAELSADEGISFALARQRAAAKKAGVLAGYLDSPNNILAVEYIKAIYDQSLGIEPVTVKRIGSGHDRTSDSGPRSASEIRRALKDGKNIAASVPKTAYEVYLREDKLGRGPVLNENLETAILSRLRMLGPEEFAGLPDAAEGLNNRLYRAAREENSIDAVISAAKSKRYALSRIRRMTMCAALGIKAEDACGLPPYIRVLAANERGCSLLREMDGKATLPVINKPAAIKSMDTECRRIFELGSDSHDLYTLGFAAKEERKGGEDWRMSPKIIKSDR